MRQSTTASEVYGLMSTGSRQKEWSASTVATALRCMPAAAERALNRLADGGYLVREAALPHQRQKYRFPTATERAQRSLPSEDLVSYEAVLFKHYRLNYPRHPREG